MTDNDKLDRAFESLESGGIVVRQNFTSTQEAGVYAIKTEIPSQRARGYVFFHMQDTDSAVAGLGLYLCYGAASDETSESIGIGQEVVAALKRQRLTVEWDGTLKKRIWVGMDWKKRRSSQS
jgi:hypothetical protein